MIGKQTILVTGANGFLGSSIIRSLSSDERYCPRGAVRGVVSGSEIIGGRYPVGDISSQTDWSVPLAGVHTVIHTAALVHVSDELDGVADPQAEYYRVNVAATVNLARQACLAGVRRFIFISSIGVNGEKNNVPFTADDEPNPVGLYAQSKLKAEIALWGMKEKEAMDIVIVRPPLIYGPNAPGNFGKLVRLISTGLPLPFGNLDFNRRSFVAIDNLVDLIVTCIDEPRAANQVFLAADESSFSTLEFTNEIAKAMGKSPFVFSFPVSMMLFVARVLGKKDMCQRLLGTLEVDIAKNRELLGWKPPLSLREGLRRCFNV